MRPEWIIAKRAVEKIVADLSDRRGLRHEWEGIDDDIREEIKRQWRKIIAEEIAPKAQGKG